MYRWPIFNKAAFHLVFLSLIIQYSQYISASPMEENSLLGASLQVITPVMVSIPSGRFKVGCVNSQDCAKIELTDAWIEMHTYKMSEHEITWAMYQPCIDAGACPENRDDGGDNGWGKGNRPVINVNWFDITEHYIPWLNDQTGNVYRLPTHEEWEYAARGGTTTAYFWGDEIGSNRANCNDCGSQWDGEKPAPVKSFAPNAYGLYDMHGNVSEWTTSCFKGPYGRLKENCGSRIMTSGGFSSLFFIVSSAAFGGKALHRRGAYGIRLVLDD